MGLAHLTLFVLSLAAGPRGLERWRPPELRVADRVPAVDPAELESIAFRYVGRPYRMGGIGRPHFDCSAFTCRVYAEAGYAIPRVSRDQARAGRSIELSSIQAGDLLFFVSSPGAQRIGHVGLYLGNGQMIHASSGQGQVVVSALDRAWYRDRLVEARRLLPDDPTRTSTAAWAAHVASEAPTYELYEHDKDNALPITVRLPLQRPPPSIGPELFTPESTYLGVRTLAATESGVFGAVIAPELRFRFERIALDLALAVPIRIDAEDGATLGPLENFGDWLRFLRNASLGLRGADLELRLARTGDTSLGEGIILDRLQPASMASGVPGMSVQRTPLIAFAGLRTDWFAVEGVVDDVVRPGVVGVGASVPLFRERLHLGASAASDARGEDRDQQRRTIWGVEGFAEARVIDSPRWTLAFGLVGAGIRAESINGGAGRLKLELEHRFGSRGSSAIGLEGRASWLGAHYLDRFFGPTYLVSRSLHLESLSEVDRARAAAGGELLLRLGRFVFGAGFEDGVGAGRHPLDQQVLGHVELRDLSLGGGRLLDLRAGYASRAVFSAANGSSDVFNAGARLSLLSWLSVEAYVLEGDSFEVGAGLSAAWIP